MPIWNSNKNTEELHAILIISDDDEMASVWAALFEQKKCHVFVETSGRMGLQSARLLVPTLIILDLDLSVDERLGLCKDLRAATDGTLCLLAPKNNEVEFTNYRYAGVDEFIPTPISPMVLLIKAMAWLVREEWILPNPQFSRAYA